MLYKIQKIQTCGFDQYKVVIYNDTEVLGISTHWSKEACVTWAYAKKLQLKNK